MRIIGPKCRVPQNLPEESRKCDKCDYLEKNTEPLDVGARCFPGKFTKRQSTTRNIQVKLFNVEDEERILQGFR